MKLFKDLNILARDEAFRKAAAVYPVTSMDDFYRLHAYFSRVIFGILFYVIKITPILTTNI